MDHSPNHILKPTSYRTTFLVLLALACCACGRRTPSDEHRYELKGKVVAVDKRGRSVTVAHEAIPGYMEAMAMPFKLKDEWAYNELAPGDRLQATLVVQGESTWLEDLVFTRESPDPAAAPTRIEPQAGEEVPDFVLTNQDGRRIHVAQYRGRALVLTFIYTRCPLPDYCPLMTTKFTDLLKEVAARPALADRTRLLTISVDPEYDTPAILRKYAAETAGLRSFDKWEFATGSSDQVKSVASYFGLTYWPEGDQIVHSLRTAVVTPEGKLARLYRGNDWQPTEIVSELTALNPD